MKLSKAHWRVLRAMAAGERLKAHRSIEGEKVFRLHPLDGAPHPVERAVVETLVRHGLIDSNKKFPTASFWLTPQGAERARAE
jgi:uncharacterized protein YjhX (UPF0386 family)